MNTPVLFTHSYFAGGGAVQNPAAAYISAAVICKGKEFSETVEIDGVRYVYSFWLDISADQLVAVRPSDEVIAGWLASHGGLLTALMVEPCHGNEIARVKASMREASSRSGFTWDAIAGDVLCADMAEHLIGLLGEEHRTAVEKHFIRKSNR
jgi:hypothetical protein